jgi:DUF1680 family protein
MRSLVSLPVHVFGVLMRSVLSFTAVLLIGICAAHAQVDTVMLPLSWKFRIGDDARWANPSLDDRSWKAIEIGALWEDLGYPGYDGCAWYRGQFVIPGRLIDRSFHHAGVKIRLGMIDDADSTFVNGTYLGSARIWNLVREYHIGPGEIRRGEMNTVAVRVYDWGGGGGIYAPPFDVISLTVDDCAQFTPEMDSTLLTHSTRTPGHASFWLRNRTARALNGTVRLRAREVPSDSILIVRNFAVSLARGERELLSVDVPGSSARLVRYMLSYRDSTEHVSSRPSVFASRRDDSPNPVEKPAAPVVAVTGTLQSLLPGSISPAGTIGERFFINLRSRLMAIDQYRFLRGFTDRPGEQEWIGEHAGKYLHAASRAWLATRNDTLKRQMDRVANILISSQDEDGYLGTYLKQDRWTHWDVWVHKYDLVGLLAYYEATGYVPALDASRRIANLLCDTFGDGPGQRDIITTSEWNGMASTSAIDPISELYHLTGTPAYLAYCESIVRAYEHADGSNLINALLAKQCVLSPRSQKAYEMLSNLRGLLRLHQLTGEADLRTAVVGAWNDVATCHTYVTGSASTFEQFRAHNVLPASAENHIAEGCVTTTWMQLTSDLYAATGETRYSDELERTVFNHLLASENPHTGNVCSYPPLQGVRKFTNEITCCQSSIGRGIALIPDLIWQRHTQGGLCLSLLIPSSVTDTVRESSGKTVTARLRLETLFPQDSVGVLTVKTDEPVSFPLRLRVPSWSAGMRVKCGGDELTGIPGAFLVLDRRWQDSTRINISVGMNLRVLTDTVNYPGRAGLAIGPQVLALDLRLNPEARSEAEVEIGEDAIGGIRPVDNVLPSDWIGRQAYSVPGYIGGKPSNLILVPYADAGQTGGESYVWLLRH